MEVCVPQYPLAQPRRWMSRSTQVSLGAVWPHAITLLQSRPLTGMKRQVPAAPGSRSCGLRSPEAVTAVSWSGHGICSSKHPLLLPLANGPVNVGFEYTDQPGQARIAPVVGRRGSHSQADADLRAHLDLFRVVAMYESRQGGKVMDVRFYFLLLTFIALELGSV
ncbi:hypothetical protein VTK56DRAFT_8801 [Thermocarpiscus australiensis]